MMKISLDHSLRHMTVLAVACMVNLALLDSPADAQTASSGAVTPDATQGSHADSRTDIPPLDSRNNALQEVIVTAERRSVDIQHTAASVTTRSGVELAEQGKYTTVQILQDIPGVVAVPNSSQNTGSADVQGNNITIRGITPGTSAGGGPSQISATPATAVYVDGVYEGVGANFDIERVEVLRGPQGTLYGRSATAGVLAIHTRDPVLNSVTGNAAVEFGNYSLSHYLAAVNLPVGDTVAVRLAADYRDQREGYYGEDIRGMGSSLNGRAKMLWKPSDNFSLLLGFASETDKAFSGGNATTADLARNTTAVSSADYPGHKLSREYWAEMKWDLGPAVITYQPAFRTWSQDDLRLQSPNFIFSGVPLEQTIQTPLDQFHTQELRIASKDDAAVQWQGGVFYYRNKLNTSNNTYLATQANTEIAAISVTSDRKDTKDLGYFGEMTFPLASSLRATLGIRYDNTEVVTSEDFFNNPYAFCGTALWTPPAGFPPPFVNCIGPGQASNPTPPGASINDIGVTYHNFNYKARLEYDLTSRNMMYGMISTGFRPGDAGIVQLPPAPPPAPAYGPNILAAEKLTAYELGTKNRFMGDSLQINADVYYYDYEGFQTTYRVRVTDLTAIPVTVPARNVGIDFESLYRITGADSLGLNYSYVRSRWTNKPAGFAAAYPDDTRALIPQTITARYEHIFQLPNGSNFTARIDGVHYAAHLSTDLHADQIALGAAQYLEVGAQNIGNLSGTWLAKSAHVSITGYVRNFTDQRYVNYSFQGDPTHYGVDWSDPRIYGVIVTAQF